MKGEGDEEADGRTEENMRHACRAGMEGTNRNNMYCDSGIGSNLYIQLNGVIIHCNKCHKMTEG